MKKAVILFCVVLIFGLGFYLGARHAPRDHDQGAIPAPTVAKSQTWTCSMHPQIRQPNPGRCPICGMDLIPVSTGEGAEDNTTIPRLTVSNSAKALMDVETTVVERRHVDVDVRMVGKAAYDESRLAYISAWIPGRIDRLYADYTGIPVNKGDHMVDLYSPELLSAQEELRRAVRQAASIQPNSPDILKQTAETTVAAVRRKLSLWGLTDAQIAAAEKSGDVPVHITIYAPIGGTVVEKVAKEGMYVETGTPIYTLADLRKLWVMLDAYESDLPWLHYGQTVGFETEAYPGETFEGRIAFIDPVLDEMTRTVKVRVNVDNTAGKLKPQMFVRARVTAKVSAEGKVMDPGLAGKWISPMHPEIIKDGPGTCDVCGMPLVRAETLGYVSPDETTQGAPLVIPASAPLLTGKRAVVYVELPNTDKPTFEGREVVLGPRGGDFYIVREGLQEGERVVTNGNFKIDSALQILAKPSMMNPVPTTSTSDEKTQESAEIAPEAFQKQLAGVLDAYLQVQDALAGDSLPKAKEGASKTRSALTVVDTSLLKGDAHMKWMASLENMNSALNRIEQASGIEAARESFELLSTSLADAVARFGVGANTQVYRIHCPMAFNSKGADWIQKDQDVRNPYFGASMLTCGSVTADLTQQGAHSHD